MNHRLKPTCFFSPSEIQESKEQIFEKKILDILKSNYPVYLTINNLQYSLNHFNPIIIYKTIVSLEKKGLIKRITIFHHIDEKSVSFNGYQFNLNKK